MVVAGAGNVGHVVSQYTVIGVLLENLFDKKTDPLHLLPSADLIINNSDSQEAHALQKRWLPNLHLEPMPYRFINLFLITILGGHTVGITHCSTISDRFYNYQNTGGPDPEMDPAPVSILRSTCPQNAAVDNAVAVDQMSPLVVDNSFYKQLLMRRGILPIDQALALDSSTKFTVISLANGVKFPAGLGKPWSSWGL
ncbi:PREDICTED: peroxidase 60-like [Nelumbo nucifera]|uniref:Peroxidase 60-like n=1 Tax=Nelumbo nucifera TaxID=4432 RepID=A0A1U8Q3N6_NELNU|nr:PREDICTED: peroxidase 60-like [Nelumbo nucifera]